MNDYPEEVSKLVADYLDRVQSKLQGIPAFERREFIRELQSHLYEAYRQASGDDALVRMLGVMRKLGEPSEVVCDRLPSAMLRSGSKRKLPLYLVGAVLVALFGIPLGFSGISVLLGLLSGLAVFLFGFYLVAGSTVLLGGVVLLLGLARLYQPAFWDALLASGMVQLGPADNLFNLLPDSAQAMTLLLAGGLLLTLGISLFWLGNKMLRGLRFLCLLSFNWTRRLIQRIRSNFGHLKSKAWSTTPAPAFHAGFSA